MAFTYVGKFLSNMKGFYDEINPSTLSGAIDVIIVQQEDGTFMCSPFHVKFGKLGVIRSREKIVDIEINETYVEDLHMKLGEAGEAFFVREIESSEEGDELTEDLVTSPLWSGTEDGGGHVDPLTPVNHDEPDDDDMASDDAKHVNQIIFVAEGGADAQTAALVIPPAIDDAAVADTPTPTGALPIDLVEQSVATITNDQLSGLCEKVADPCDNRRSTGTRRRKKNLKRAPVTHNKSEDVPIRTTFPCKGSEDTPSPMASRTLPATENSLPEAITTILLKSSAPGADVTDDVMFPMEDSEGADDRRSSDLQYVLSRDSITTGGTEGLTLQSPPGDYSSARPSFSLQGAAPVATSDHSETLKTCLLDVINAESLGSERFPPSRSLCGSLDDVGPLNFQNSKFVALSENDLSSYATVNTGSSQFNDPERYKSDTEIENDSNKAHHSPDHPVHVVEWNWGKLPERKTNSQPNSPDKGYAISLADSLKDSNHRFDLSYNNKPTNPERSTLGHSSSAKGVYLDDLKSGDLDPEMAAVYFPQRPNRRDVAKVRCQVLRAHEEIDGDESSSHSASSPPPHLSVDPSLIEYPSSPSSVTSEPSAHATLEPRNSIIIKEDRGTDRIDYGWGLSLCGSSLDQGPTQDFEVSPERFERYAVSYDNLVKDPSIFLNPDLTCRLNDKYYSWQIAAPLITSLYLFNKPLPETSLEMLAKLLPPKRSSRSSWFPWRSRYHQQYPYHKASIESAPGSSDLEMADKKRNSLGRSELTTDSKLATLKRSTSFDLSHPNGPVHINGDVTNPGTNLHKVLSSSAIRKTAERCKKTLRLTSDQIVKLNLVDGCNDVTFSVTTQFQGTTRCASHIFLWRYDDKIVISDIDGTITKSDVLGHIFPFLGKDWSQCGVAELYSRIRRNGYQFVYLSSRAIGQAPGTRGYLKSLKQNNMPLPEGPILLNPNSLLTAFHKEVIEKKPEEFKISCLRDIRALFPPSRNPFFAGFGNRINDVYSYRAVHIPISRIFTINHRGEITLELTKTFQSSYIKLQDLVDQLFPPLKQLERKRVTDLLEADRFSSFTFWRAPLTNLEEVVEGDDANNVGSSTNKCPNQGPDQVDGGIELSA